MQLAMNSVRSSQIWQDLHKGEIQNMSQSRDLLNIGYITR